MAIVILFVIAVAALAYTSIVIAAPTPVEPIVVDEVIAVETPTETYLEENLELS